MGPLPVRGRGDQGRVRRARPPARRGCLQGRPRPAVAHLRLRRRPGECGAAGRDDEHALPARAQPDRRRDRGGEPGLGRRARVPDRAQRDHRDVHQAGGRGIHQPHLAPADPADGGPARGLEGALEPAELDHDGIQPALSLAFADARRDPLGRAHRADPRHLLRQCAAARGRARARLRGHERAGDRRAGPAQHRRCADRDRSGGDPAGAARAARHLCGLSRAGGAEAAAALRGHLLRPRGAAHPARRL